MASLNVPEPTCELKEAASLTWTIDEFAQVVRVMSPLFSPPNSNNRFQFRLFQDDLSKIFLTLIYKGSNKEGYFYYRYSILDANGEKHRTREYIWNYNSLYSTGSHVSIYLSRDQLENLLVNGSLIIHCDICIFDNVLPRPLQIDSFDNLSQNFETLFESGKLADFSVLVGDKQFRVHKAILAAQSKVFAAMFDHEDTKEVKKGQVVIEDVEVDIFELLIRYIYTGMVDNLGEHADELFVAADKYQLDLLKTACERSLISSLNAESVCGILLLSDMHSAEQLKSKCIEYIVEHAREVMQSDGWIQMVNKTNRIDLVVDLFEKLVIKDE